MEKLHKPIVVLKVGTSSLVDVVSQKPKVSSMARLAEATANLISAGFHVIIVSSGAVGLGCARVGLKEKPSYLAGKQAAAAIGQVRLMALWDALLETQKLPCAQALLSADVFGDRTQYLNARNTLVELLRMGVVPVINENDTVAVQELRVGDNDTLSALVAAMVSAEWLFLFTDVDSLFDANPRDDATAAPIRVVPPEAIGDLRRQMVAGAPKLRLPVPAAERAAAAAAAAAASFGGAAVPLSIAVAPSTAVSTAASVVRFADALVLAPGLADEAYGSASAAASSAAPAADAHASAAAAAAVVVDVAVGAAVPPPPRKSSSSGGLAALAAGGAGSSSAGGGASGGAGAAASSGGKKEQGQAGSAFGTGGMATKLKAGQLASAAGVTTVITLTSRVEEVVAALSSLCPSTFAAGSGTPAAAGVAASPAPAAAAGGMLSPLPAVVPATPSPAPSPAAAPASASAAAVAAAAHERRLVFARLGFGSTLLPSAHPVSGRKRWILGLAPAGRIIIDAGAVAAVVRARKSLFPAGVVRVEGEFDASEAVAICSEAGVEVARALTNYGADDIRKIRGRRSKDVSEALGYPGAEAVADRDNIVRVLEAAGAASPLASLTGPAAAAAAAAAEAAAEL